MPKSTEQKPGLDKDALRQRIRSMKSGREEFFTTGAKQARDNILRETGEDIFANKASLRQRVEADFGGTYQEEPPPDAPVDIVIGTRLAFCEVKLVDRVRRCVFCGAQVGLAKETPLEPPLVCSHCFHAIDPEAN